MEFTRVRAIDGNMTKHRQGRKTMPDLIDLTSVLVSDRVLRR